MNSYKLLNIKFILVLFLLVFLSFYLFLQLYAGFIMGGGESSYWLFNEDNAFRLTHAWQVLRADSYPPESLSNLNVAYGYHYGAPAIAAFLSDVSGFPLDVVYLEFTSSFLLVLAMLVLYSVVFNKTKKVYISLFAVAVSLLWSVNYWDFLERVRSSSYSLLYAMWELDYDKVVNASVGVYSHWFGNGVLDVSYIVLYLIFSLFLSFILIGSSTRRLLLLFILSPFVFLLKIDALLFVVFYLYVELMYLFFKSHNIKWFFVFHTLLVSFVIALGYFGVVFVIQSVEYRFGLVGVDAISVEGILLLCVLCYVFFDSYINKRLNSYGFIFLLSSFSTILVIKLVSIYVGDIRGMPVDNAGLLFSRAAQFLVLGGLILYLISFFEGGVSKTKNIAFVMVVSISLFVLFFKFYHVLVQSWVMVNKTESVYRGANLVDYHKCLSEVPVDDVLIYSNYFEYPSNTLEGRDMGMHLTALFGHQAYASNSFYERYPHVFERIDNQKKVLSNKNSTLKDVCDLVEDPWRSYVLFDKRVNLPLSIKSLTFYENDTCSILNVDDVCNH
jgi:hypothetical protein